MSAEHTISFFPQKILIVGNGGREHAFAQKFKEDNPNVQLFSARGNGGTAQIGENIPLDPMNISSLAQFAEQNQIDLTVAGMEGPICAGIGDEFVARGLRIFAPSKKAARLEASKAETVRIAQEIGLPIPESAICNSFGEVEDALRRNPHLTVVKADGLAEGKAVDVCDNADDALSSAHQMMIKRKFGKAGETIVLQEKEVGEEISLMAWCDGDTAIPLLPAQDSKLFNGKNTGGMGAFAPVPASILSESEIGQVIKEFFDPTLSYLREQGTPYKGILYAGLMNGKRGRRLIEYNTRAGDPEIQALLALLKTNLGSILNSCIDGTLRDTQIEYRKGAAACIVLASEGYPGNYDTGFVIEGLDQDFGPDVNIFHAGTALEMRDGKLIPVTKGGRVLGVTARGSTVHDAAQRAYTVIPKIHYKNKVFKEGIGLS